MDLNQQKEAFSKAYIRAIAAAAGYFVDQPETDFDSVDLRITARGSRGAVRSPQLELQLKCTAMEILPNESIRYPLKLKNYNDLRMEDFLVPRILVVVKVPENPSEWTEQQFGRGVLMRCSGYWRSLRGEPEIRNTATVTVTLLQPQLFTVEALKYIMERIGQGEFL